MNVLFCMRSDFERNIDEDTLYAFSLLKYLEKTGVNVRINNGFIEDYNKYDIIHLFNLNALWETYDYFKKAKRDKKCVVISPMYWNPQKFIKKVKFKEDNFWNKCKIYKNEILKGSSSIYTTNSFEGECLKNDFGNWLDFKVIHYGVEECCDDLPIYNFRERYNLERYVLSIDKVCEEGNQLTLAKICKDLGYNLVICGEVKDKDYFNQCLRYPNIRYIKLRDNYELYNACKFSRVTAFINCYKTNYFYVLKAASTGTNLLLSKEKGSFEYIKEMGFYCDPYNENDIKSSLKNAYKSVKTNILSNYIMNNFNWNQSALKLYDSYLENNV